MAGKPNTRIKKLTNTLTEALSSGQRDVAALAYAEIRRTVGHAGMDMPDLPAEASEMWLQITEGAPAPPSKDVQVEAKLSDETRRVLLQAGDLAAGHLRDLMAAPGLFGPLGIVPVRDQIAALNTVMARSFGVMPAGAQRVGSVRPGEVEQEQPQVGSTLSMMIRQKQQPQPAMRVVRGDIEDVSEGDLDGE